MRKNIRKVIDAFLSGKSISGDSCRTDGEYIYSYSMVIACKTVHGKVLVPDREAAPSATTRSQIDACHFAIPNVNKIEASRWLEKYSTNY